MGKKCLRLPRERESKKTDIPAAMSLNRNYEEEPWHFQQRNWANILCNSKEPTDVDAVYKKRLILFAPLALWLSLLDS